MGGEVGAGGEAGRGGSVGATNLLFVSAGGRHSCVKDATGTVSCWGDTIYGQSTVPPGEYTLVSCGNLHTCGIDADDTVVCWGSHFSANLPEGAFDVVRCGYNYNTCGVRSGGAVECWGRDNFGELRPPPDLKATDVDVGFRHSCAIQLDGLAVCWGLNLDGEGSPPDDVQLDAITVGGTFSCGLDPTGAVACWGNAPPPPTGAFVQLSAGYFTVTMKSPSLPRGGPRSTGSHSVSPST